MITGRPECSYNSANQSQEKINQNQGSCDPTTSQSQDFSEENRRVALFDARIKGSELLLYISWLEKTFGAVLKSYQKNLLRLLQM